MVELVDYASKIHRIVSELSDQSDFGRRRAYERLRSILTVELSKLPHLSHKERVRTRFMLEQEIREVEYRIVILRSDAMVAPASFSTADKESVALMRGELEFILRGDTAQMNAGPTYDVIDGKLARLPQTAPLAEVNKQRIVHMRLAASSSLLANLLEKSANQYPVLSRIAGEYNDLLGADTSKLDVTSLWSVGTALANLHGAYKSQDASKTLATPLEPDCAAMLESVVREHGAFIMGFDVARDLIERADQFAMNTDLLKHLQKTGSGLLDELADNKELIAPKTLLVHRSIRDAASETGWSYGRSGFDAYITVRNAVGSIIRASVGSDVSMLSFYGLASATADMQGLATREFLANGASMLLAHGPALQAFFAHSVEFASYITWALDLLERDRRLKIDVMRTKVSAH